MRSVILSVVVSTLLVFPVTAAPKVFSTSVITAKGAAVSNDTYDKWAETSTELAQTKNQDFDIACDVTVVRSGDVVEHTTIPKLIDSVALMNQVRALQADVFVIEQLKYCGGAEAPAGTEFAGCAISGPLILVNRQAATGQSLIHEIGHKAGLNHTWPTPQCTVTQPSGLSLAGFVNLMYCMNHSKRLVLTQSDCTTLKNTGFAAPGADLAATQDAMSPSSPTELSLMEEFLLYGFAEGIPFAQIETLTAEQVEEVRALLASNNDELWEGAALVLGLRGDAADVERLVGLAQRAADVDTPGAFRAQTSIPDAIAFFIMRGEATGRDLATSFLLTGVNVERAAGRANSDEDAPLVARSYLRAAALTGQPDIADAALEIATQQVETSGRSDVATALGLDFQMEVADLALRVMDQGLEPAINQLPSIRGNAIDLLQQRNLEQLTLPIVPETLRELGIEGEIMQRFQ
jgi:hypothetical protein